MRTLGIVVAAGSGTRLGADLPKALVPLAGRPLVWHAARRLVDAGCTRLVIAAPAAHVTQMRDAVFGAPPAQLPPGADLPEEGGWSAVGPDGDRIEVDGWVTAGGSTRQESVANVVASLDPHTTRTVLVHDAARPLAPVEVIRSVIEAVEAGAQAVIPGLPVTDTIKRVAGAVVVETVERSELVAVQTPQGFDFSTLYRAHRDGRDLAASEATAVSDDAGLVERLLDVAVRVVPGAPRAMKITTAADLAFAETMLATGEWT